MKIVRADPKRAAQLTLNNNNKMIKGIIDISPHAYDRMVERFDCVIPATTVDMMLSTATLDSTSDENGNHKMITTCGKTFIVSPDHGTLVTVW